MIGITTEKRILALDQDNKARKAAYPIAGSLIAFVNGYSSTYSRTSNGETITARIKFQTTTPNSNGKSLVTLLPQISINSDFSTSYPIVFSINEPQAGDGSVVLSLSIGAPPTGTNTFYFRAVSSGASTGTFTLL